MTTENPNTIDRLLQSHPIFSFILISSFTLVCYLITATFIIDIRLPDIVGGMLVGFGAASAILIVRRKAID